MQLQNIDELKKFWNLIDTPVLHRNVANFIYFGSIADELDRREVVIRLTPVSQRSAAEVQAELQWMQEVGNNGLQVPNLILSSTGRLFETLTVNEKQFHVMVMDKIIADRINEATIDDKIILKWSDLLAQLQSLSKKPDSGLARLQWDQDYTYVSCLPELQNRPQTTQDLFQQLVAFVKNYPKDQYGLIHADVHTGNFFYKDDQLIIFDFDDCSYHYFLYDLTVPVLSLYKLFESPNDFAKRNRFINLFIHNYLKNKVRPANFKSDFIKFIQYRSLTVHVWLCKIRHERQFSEAMAKHFNKAIEDDLYIATHPEIFDFIDE